MDRDRKSSALIIVRLEIALASCLLGQNVTCGFCYDLALKSGHFQGYWATDIPKVELRVVQLQFLIMTTDFDDEEMPKPAGKGPNDEEEVKEIIFPRYD